MPEIRSPPAVPAFTPVPIRARKDGWTEERQRTFIRVLAETRCIGAAASAAGMSRESAYRLRRRKGAESFARAWDSILAARPRGATGFDLTWHRIVKRAVAAGGSVRSEAASSADRLDEGLEGFAGHRRRGRSQ